MVHNNFQKGRPVANVFNDLTLLKPYFVIVLGVVTQQPRLRLCNGNFDRCSVLIWHPVLDLEDLEEMGKSNINHQRLGFPIGHEVCCLLFYISVFPRRPT